MSDITLLDGGMGQELVRRSSEKPTALWSTRIMLDNPGLVQQVHADYFAAGATVATANTYAIHRDRLRVENIEDQLETLHAAALTEANDARAAHGSGRVAGAIGPLGASYQPDIHAPLDDAVRLYAEIAQLIAPRVDLIIIETASSLLNAKAALKGALPTGRPVWLALSVNDTDGTCLRSGEPVTEAIALAQDGADAVLVNCSTPEACTQAIELMVKSDLPTGGYANGFTHISDGFLKPSPTVDALVAREDLGPKAYADHVMRWVDMGATIVGGCCETGPDHIAEIAHRLTAAGHRVV